MHILSVKCTLADTQYTSYANQSIRIHKYICILMRSTYLACLLVEIALVGSNDTSVLP
jgi:hypothetical protein